MQYAAQNAKIVEAEGKAIINLQKSLITFKQEIFWCPQTAMNRTKSKNPDFGFADPSTEWLNKYMPYVYVKVADVQLTKF